MKLLEILDAGTVFIAGDLGYHSLPCSSGEVCVFD